MSKIFPASIRNSKLVWLGIFCAVIPDADVISFSLGVPYEAFWGHRGFTHSLAFAAILGLVLTWMFYPQLGVRQKALVASYYFLCTASHGLLDAMTTGGLGVAFFSPFNTERFFLPYRPIQVSPIGVSNFFSEWGIRVVQSELVWIGIPSLMLFTIGYFIYSKASGSSHQSSDQ